MIKPVISAALCAACLLTVTPVLAAENTIPQGKRDEMSQNIPRTRSSSSTGRTRRPIRMSIG